MRAQRTPQGNASQSLLREAQRASSARGTEAIAEGSPGRPSLTPLARCSDLPRPTPGEGEALVSGGVVAAGTGKMSRSAPPFGVPEDEGLWPWEEAGLLVRWAQLDPTGGEG